MQDRPDRSTQDTASDLLAPPPEVFADLLARTLAELPPEPKPPAEPEPEPEPERANAVPRQSLIHRILGRRSRRPLVTNQAPAPPVISEPVTAAAVGDDDDDDALLLDDAVPHEEPAPPVFSEPVTAAAVGDDDDDALLLDDEVPHEEPAPPVFSEPVPAAAAEEEEEEEEEDNDDVLLLDDEVPHGEPAPPVFSEPVTELDDDTLRLLLADEPDLEPAAPPVEREALPTSLTPDSEPFGGDNRPSLLERLFSRHTVTSSPGEVIRYEPPPLSPPSAQTDDDGIDEDEDVIILDDSFLVAAPEPEPPPPPAPPSPMEAVAPPPPPAPEHSTDFLLHQVLDALNRQASIIAASPLSAEGEGANRRDLLQQALVALPEPEPPPSPSAPAPEPTPAIDPPAAPEMEAEGDDDVLVLDDGYLVETAPPAPAAVLVAMTADEMTALIAAATPDGAGTLDLPDCLEALGALLLTPPDDFTAQDLLHECWPRGSSNITSRALLAVAVNLSRNFGLPGKLPMAASKAWRMLDPYIFQVALAQRLAAISDFIFAWQRSQYTFLSLEFGEIELIEYLFEGLHPGQNTELLASVMNFKVLSGRRIGLLRRIPGHSRRVVEELGPSERERALGSLAHIRTLLVRIAQPDGFPPVVEAAHRSLTEVEKVMEQLANPPASPAADGRRPGGGLPLGRI